MSDNSKRYLAPCPPKPLLKRLFPIRDPIRIFVRLPRLVGGSLVPGYADCFEMLSLGFNISRSIPGGAVGEQRSRGEVQLSDVECIRETDPDSAHLLNACANGNYFHELEIHCCVTRRGVLVPRLMIYLDRPVVVEYSFYHEIQPAPRALERISFQSELRRGHIRYVDIPHESPCSLNPIEGEFWGWGKCEKHFLPPWNKHLQYVAEELKQRDGRLPRLIDWFRKWGLDPRERRG